jgi:uncharacterized peroxidase-related enzyme
MSRLPIIEPEQATGEARELLEQVRTSLGVVPNMTKVMANSPAVLRGYPALSAALTAGGFDPGTRERIAITVAGANRCGYCPSAHTYIGAPLAEIEESELDLARQADSGDTRTAAVLRPADKIARDRGRLDDAVFTEFRAAGLTDAEIAETVGPVALNVLTNLFNVLAQVDNDRPVVTPRAAAA